MSDKKDSDQDNSGNDARQEKPAATSQPAESGGAAVGANERPVVTTGSVESQGPADNGGKTAVQRAGANHLLTRKEEEAAVEAPPDEASSVAAENSTAKASEAKVEQAKVEQAKAEQAKAEQAKAEQAKAEQAKAEQAKAEQAKAEQAKAEQAKSEQARAAATAALPPSGAAVDHGSGSSGIAWLALLLALGLAAGAGWFFVEAHKRESELVERLQSLESATTDLASSRQALETKTRSLATRTDSLGEKTAALESVTGELRASTGTPGLATGDLDLDALGERLDGRIQAAVSEAVAVLESGVAEQSQQLQTLAAQLAARADAPSADINRDKWLLAEVEYLLRLANQRLIMTGDTAAARALLTSADNILRDLDDVGLLGVRGAIASDLASIRAAPQIDIEGNYVRLAALIDQVDRLVIFALPEVESPAIEVQTSDDWQGRLRRGYQEALDKLASYVVVRRRETPAEALMDPQWERLVRQNLRMLLEQAQVALISGNQVLYRESLDRSRHWVAEFFESDQSAAEAMNREISSLMEQTVAVELPDIADSMRELDAAVKQRLRPAGGQ